MSPDQIFAAQMWNWPDPMIKRDPAGKVLVINAAFIGLYGGNVESWTGQTIQGWPQPNPSGQSTRFESRMPGADALERIFDWMETTLQDGSALALARDVTNYAAAQPSGQTVQTTEAETPAISTPISDTAILDTNTGDPVSGDPVSGAPETPPHTIAQPVQSAAQVLAKPDFTKAAQDEPMQPAQMPSQMPIAAPSQPLASQPLASTEQHQNTAQALAPAVQANAAALDDRSFERRALPIDSESAILGNNWRDAVIAKAVGAEVAETPQPQETSLVMPANPEQDTSESSNQCKRILLAEDNAINALLTRTLLEAEGCEVEVVEDGALAVQAIESKNYDMIFMDMRMPNMDGLEATRKIRAMGHNPKKLPIVALTANAFDDDRNACFDSGMNDFMTKPVSAEELSEMVRTHTGAQQKAEKIAS